MKKAAIVLFTALIGGNVCGAQVGDAVLNLYLKLSPCCASHVKQKLAQIFCDDCVNSASSQPQVTVMLKKVTSPEGSVTETRSVTSAQNIVLPCQARKRKKHSGNEDRSDAVPKRRKRK